ncbi:MAG: putative Ig domain-containing protein [Chthoniobacterales bacterium]
MKTSSVIHLLRACAFFGLLLPPLLPAATLTLDQNFRAPFFGRINPAGQSVLLPDGKFLLFGKADSLASQHTGPLIRFLADGSVDSSFNFSHDYSSVGEVGVLSNGQLVVSATQTTYGSMPTEQILRVNANGAVDPTFSISPVESRSYGTVKQIVQQSDGKILVAGWFDTFAGLSRQKIVRLMADGSVDAGFNPPTSTAVYGIWSKPLLLAGGKFLVGGDFTSIDGSASPGVARLNSDGTFDSTFQPSGFIRVSGSPIRAVALQSDGKIVLGGRFQLSLPTRRVPLFRLNANGAADTSFAYPIQTTAYDLAVRANDKLVAAVSGTYAGAIYQFSADGTIDPTFQVPSFFDDTFSEFAPGTPYSLGLLSDGRILAGGLFTDVGSGTGLQHFGVARLNADGTLDPTLSNIPKTGYATNPQSFVRLSDQSTLACFGADVEPSTPSNLPRFLADGSIDSTFQLTSSDPNSIVASGFTALTLTPVADGKLFISGYPPDEVYRSGKFLTDGTEDLGFHSGYERGFQIGIALTDGKVLLSAGDDPQDTLSGGILTRRQFSGNNDYGFSLAPEIMAAQVTRLFNGVLDQMHVGSRVLAAQPDGKVLFVYFSGTDEQYHLIRLAADGSIDGTFNETAMVPLDVTIGYPYVYDYIQGANVQPPDGVYRAVSPVADAHVFPDGRILLVGRFTSFNGTPARGMIRLLADGTVDSTFSAGGGAQWTTTTETSTFYPGIEAIAEEVDGTFLIAGTFEAFNGTPLPGIASLHPDGTVDTSFTPVARRLKFASGSAKLERQPDGSFLLSGPYSFPNENETAFIHINSVGGIPIIGSPALAAVVVGQNFRYQIVASGQPTSYEATGLPAGFAIDGATGVITGTPTANQVGTYQITLTATNGSGTSTPRILTFRVPGALQISSAASRKAHGSAGSFDIGLPLTGSPGVECRSSNSGSHTLVFTFNNDVARASAALAQGSGNIISLNNDGNTVQVGLANVADQQQITLMISGLTDVYGQTLPDISLTMNVLLGDTNGNGSVTSSDVGQTKAQSGGAVTSANFRNDVNLSGTISSSDIGLVKANSGHSITPPSKPTSTRQ